MKSTQRDASFNFNLNRRLFAEALRCAEENEEIMCRAYISFARKILSVICKLITLYFSKGMFS